MYNPVLHWNLHNIAILTHLCHFQSSVPSVFGICAICAICAYLCLSVPFRPTQEMAQSHRSCGHMATTKKMQILRKEKMKDGKFSLTDHC